MADLSKLPKDYYVTSMQFTKNVQQDVYPAIDPSLAEHSLAGKVAIITGASRGIGALVSQAFPAGVPLTRNLDLLTPSRVQAMVPAFTKAGVKGVVLLASNAEKLAATEKSVKAASSDIETLTCALDISDTKAVEAAFEKVKERFGHADILINAAGAMTGDGVKLHETDPDEWWRNFVRVLIRCDLTSCWLTWRRRRKSTVKAIIC
jgi:hypothetical protein